jgi:hypothetical protein
MKKRYYILLCPYIAAILLLTGCAVTKNKVVYRTDLSTDSLAKAIESNLDEKENLIDYSDEEIAFYLDVPDDLANEQTVKVQTNAKLIDEFGIFKIATDETADKLEHLLEAYLFSSLEGKKDWLRGYNPTELEKLENAEINRVGNYVYYFILDEKDQAEAENTLKQLLSVENSKNR